MKDSRKSKAQKNIVFSLGSQMITLVCGLIVPQLLLTTYGSETYGAVSSITQFLSYIALLEGGIGGVARAVLYKPLAEQDIEKISAVLYEIKRFFHVIACIFAVYVLVLAFGYKSISGLESLDWLSSFALVLAISFSTFGEYFIGISNEILIQASQRSYIKHGIAILVTILNTIMVIVLIHAGYGLVFVKFVSSCVFFLRPILHWLYIKKNYKLVTPVNTKTEYLEQKWSGLGQHIAYFLHSNADIVILTLCSNLKSVAIYSVYNMVVSNMQKLTISFTSGMEALFGDMLAKEEDAELNKAFNHYETIISLITMTLFSITAVLLVPFIQLYTVQINDAEYFEPVFGVLLTLAAVLYCIRLPYHALVIAAGHFRQTNKVAYLEVILNVSLSVFLVRDWGLAGVAFGTVVATAVRLVYYVVYLSQNILYRNVSLFLKRFMVNAVSFLLIQALGEIIVSYNPIETYLQWFLAAVMVGIATLLVIFSINFMFYYREFQPVIRKFLKKLVD